MTKKTTHDRSMTHENRPATNEDRSTTHDIITPTPTRTRSQIDNEDVHADAHASNPSDSAYDHDPGPFPHEKLDVYRVALEMAALAKDLAAQIPRGHRNVADHLIRAAEDTVLLCAEGANRRGAALKRQRFVESRGEVGEAASAADLIIMLRLGDADRASKMKRLAARVSAMLTRMIARVESETGPVSE